MNILQAFYILFKSDADKALKETQALERSSEVAAAAVDALGVAHGGAAAAAVEGAAVQTGALGEVAAAEAMAGAAAAAAGAEAYDAHILAWKGAQVELEGEEALGAAYVFNRMQRQELMGLARHSFDQLASGGSLMRVVASHAATLAEALGSGEGGLAAGFGALAGAAGRFVRTWGLPLAAIASLVAVVGIAKGSVKDLESDRLMAGRVNMDVSDLDALRKTVRALGGDTKETDKDLERFANRVDDALGGKALEGGKADRITKTLAGIGVRVKDANGDLKDTKTLLLDVAGALEGKTAAQKSEALRNLGFSSPRHGQTDPAMEKLLTGGREAMQRYIDTEKTMGVVTKEQVEAAHKWRLETEILGERFRDLRNTLAQYILPILTDLVHGIRDVIEWVRLNSTLVTGFGIAFVAMATVVSVATWGTLIPAFAAAAIAVIAATWPIILIGAAVVAMAAIFAAAYEDVMFFLKGQPSLLGELVNKYEWLRKTVHFIGDAFKWMGRTAQETWHVMAKGAQDFAAFVLPLFRGLGQILGPIFRLLIDLAVALAKTLIPVLASIGKYAVMFFKDIAQGIADWGPLLGKVAALVGMAFDAVAKFIGPIWSEMFKGWLTQLYLLIGGVRTLFNLKADHTMDGVLGKGQGMMVAAGASPLAAQSPASLAHRTQTNTVHIDKVDVHTQATDAEGIAKGINASLSTELRRAAAQFDDGVAR